MQITLQARTLKAFVNTAAKEDFREYLKYVLWSDDAILTTDGHYCFWFTSKGHKFNGYENTFNAVCPDFFKRYLIGKKPKDEIILDTKENCLIFGKEVTPLEFTTIILPNIAVIMNQKEEEFHDRAENISLEIMAELYKVVKTFGARGAYLENKGSNGSMTRFMRDFPTFQFNAFVARVVC